MATRVAPNPYSPGLEPGALAPAACGGMVVIPAERLQPVPDSDLPDGLCPACIAEMRGEHTEPATPVAECREDEHEPALAYRPPLPVREPDWIDQAMAASVRMLEHPLNTPARRRLAGATLRRNCPA